MKRTAIMLGTGTVAVAALLSGFAYGGPLDDAVPAAPAVPGVPALPDAGGLVATVTDALAGIGLPLDTPALPAVPDLTDPAAALAIVSEAVAATGLALPALPTQDPVMAVPENIVVGNLNEMADRLPLYLTAIPGMTDVVATAEESLATADEATATAQQTLATATDAVATVEQTVAGLGLPLGVPALPALTVPDATTLLSTVEQTVGSLPLGLGGILPEL